MSSSSITPQIGVKVLTALHTETPTPSRRELAKRFNVSLAAIQRYIAKHQEAERAKLMSTTKAELVVAALPQAVADVKAITKELPITKMSWALEEAESQYIRFKDQDPALAGHYLELMRKTVIEMARWLGLDKGLSLQDNEVRITVDWVGGRDGS